MTFQKVYFFADDQYWRYDIAADAVEPGWPKKIEDEWRWLPKGANGALNTDNGKAYFFYGKEYRRFDTALDRVDVGPLETTKHWPGVPDLWIDTAVRIGNGDVCFFHGNTCSRFNLLKDHTLDGYPRRIADDWPGMPDSSVDAAVNYGNGSIYFFKDDRYTRFDLAPPQHVAQAFLRITDQWHGMPDRRIDAAVEWSDANLGAACIPIYDPWFWNRDRDLRVRNNCYNYGCNRALIDFSNPGRGSGHEAPEPFTNVGLNAGVRSDGLVPTDPDNPACQGCKHLLMMFRWANGGDFHFYHRNADGLWSHKVGHDPATNLDYAGKRITDPRTADRGAYTDFCGAYCVDRSVLRIG